MIETALSSVASKVGTEITVANKAIEAKAGKLSEIATNIPKESSSLFSKGLDAIRNELSNEVFNNSTDKLLENPEVKNGLENALSEYNNIPETGGKWEGEKGNSEFHPDKTEIPKNPLTNPEGKTWEEIMNKHGIDNIEFHEGEPDFSNISETTVKIEDFSTERNDNFVQADEKAAEQFSEKKKNGKEDWTAQNVKEYRQENKLTWHERSDMKTMDLASREIHGNIPHSGGISTAKKMENNKLGR